MKILFIGGTGTISTAITKKLAASEHELYLLNRGNRNAELPEGVKFIIADINNEAGWPFAAYFAVTHGVVVVMILFHENIRCTYS